jgi:rhamnogalacturonyl hydrolase YesR
MIRSRILVAALLLAPALAAPSLGQQDGAVPSQDAPPAEHLVSLTADGAWCWFADPRAVVHRGKHNRTYLGWVTRRGDVQVGYFDHETFQIEKATLRRRFNADDHANPAIVVRPDGRLMVFYTAHSKSKVPLYVALSKRPEDIRAWEPSRKITSNTRGRSGFCYPNPIQLSDENHRLYLFWRGGNFKPTYSTSDDGVTWARARTFIAGRAGDRGNRPYCKFATNGKDRFDVAFTTGHPRNEPENAIYYASCRDGVLYRADGTRIKALDDGPLTYEEADRVYDGKRHGRAWIWDVGIDTDGHPMIVYTALPSESDHRYRYARWDGGKWTDHEICPAGGWFPKTPRGQHQAEPHYSGGAVLAGSIPFRVYVSRPQNGVFEIELFTGNEGGFHGAPRSITRNSTRNNVRPVVSRAPGETAGSVFWMHGDYEHYVRFRTGIKMDLAAADVQARELKSAPEPDAAATLAAMRKVCDWQLARLRDGEDWKGSTGWIRGAFLTGLMAAWRATGDAGDYRAAVGLAAANEWKLGERLRHADDHCVGQTYAELYEASQEPLRIAALRARFDRLMANPKPGRVDWWWCDALFMAPPALARLSALTGERKYLDFMNTMWWDCTEFLYDQEQHLYYRDNRFFDAKERNGESVFWSRGNGWVMGGTVRVLQYMPKDYPHREKYVELHRAMAARIASIQPEDGLWRSSLLDPGSQPLGETSGSGFYCFALAWGINHGLLDAEKYRPVVLKAWRSLLACVHPDGKLGYVQRVGDRPADLSRDDTQEYGVGAFLLAGEQVLKLLGHPGPGAVVPAARARREPPRRAFGRHVPERMDDFAWENDRIAFRMYGPALQATGEISSGIDVWVKSTRRLVIDDWYEKNDYHHDHGEGLDYYKVGPSRGCGGIGIWDGKQLHVSKNWTRCKVLQNGPDKVVFELTYAPWEAGERKVWETKRITLEAGSNLNRIESTLESDKPGELIVGIGITTRKGGGSREWMEPSKGILAYWEPPHPEHGSIGCGVIVDPSRLADVKWTSGHLLALVKVEPGKPLVYHAGAGWSKSGDFKDADAWFEYLKRFKPRK